MNQAKWGHGMSEHEAGTTLGRILVTSGAITEDDLTEALRRQRLGGKQLGQILVEMGVLAPPQLERALHTQSRLRGGSSYAGSFILVIDDDAEIGALLGDILKGAGYRVGVAGDEAEASAIVAATDAYRPALIVLDLGLPGPGGISLLATLQQRDDTRGIPVIVLTGNPNLEPEISARGLFVHRFLVKPVPARRLLAEVESVLQEVRQAGLPAGRYPAATEGPPEGAAVPTGSVTGDRR